MFLKLYKVIIVVLFEGVKSPEGEAYHSLPPSADLYFMAWISTTLPFMRPSVFSVEFATL